MDRVRVPREVEHSSSPCRRRCPVGVEGVAAGRERPRGRRSGTRAASSPPADRTPGTRATPRRTPKRRCPSGGTFAGGPWLMRLRASRRLASRARLLLGRSRPVLARDLAAVDHQDAVGQSKDLVELEQTRRIARPGHARPRAGGAPTRSPPRRSRGWAAPRAAAGDARTPGRSRPSAGYRPTAPASVKGPPPRTSNSSIRSRAR